MPWTIIQEDEHGDAIQTLPQTLDYDEFDELNLPAFTLFHYINPYGDTVFNCLQIDDLVKDLEQFKRISNQKSVIEEIISLAKKCKNEVHTYIRFYGD